ncbi:MAG: TadE family protein [Hyphomicrobiales bacterium]|nr:TadE family protein [Hyphomicrobiales bacterium]
MKRSVRGLLGDQSGSTAIEFSIVSLVFILTALGIFEFGRALNTRNQLSQAADYGARKLLTISGISNSAVETEIRSAFKAGPVANLTITFASESVNGAPFRVITMSYPFTLLIPGLVRNSLSLTVTRRTPLL